MIGNSFQNITSERKMNLEIVSFYSDVDGNTYYSDHAKRSLVNANLLD